MKAPVVATDCLTAEVSKTVENAYRDVNIAFANEVALICESLGVDVFEVRKLVNNLPNDPSNPGANPVRNMHLPGAGVGGHCLPKDSWLLKYGVDTYGATPVQANILIACTCRQRFHAAAHGGPCRIGASSRPESRRPSAANRDSGLRLPGGKRRHAQYACPAS